METVRKEMDMVNKAFIESHDRRRRSMDAASSIRSRPTRSRRILTGPRRKITSCLFEMTAKYGTPYFSNYVNSDMQPSDVRSMCCRLRLDLRELRKKSGGFFGSGESTGSVGVVTINLPRIAYLAARRGRFLCTAGPFNGYCCTVAEGQADRSSPSCSMKGFILIPSVTWESFDNHFSTIGLVGMNEAGLNATWLRADLTHKETQEFAKEGAESHAGDGCHAYQEEYGDLYNLEATPAESTTYRFGQA